MSLDATGCNRSCSHHTAGEAAPPRAKGHLGSALRNQTPELGTACWAGLQMHPVCIVHCIAKLPFSGPNTGRLWPFVGQLIADAMVMSGAAMLIHLASCVSAVVASQASACHM